MKFMTPATVKNLPGYLADDRQRSLLRREAERYQEEKDSKEMAAEIGFKMLKATNEAQDQNDLFQKFDQIKSEYGGKVPPETMQIAANLVQRFGQEKLAGEDRAMKMEDRQMLLDKTRQQDEAKDIVNRSLLGAGQMPYTGEGVGMASAGVPARDASRMGQTDQGLLNTLVDNPDAGFLMRDIQGKQAAGQLDTAKTKAEIDKLKSQAEKNRRPGTGKQPSTADLKYMQEQSTAQLKSIIPSFGGRIIQDLDGNEAMYVPVDKQGNPDSRALQAIDQSGYSFNMSGQDIIEEDGQRFMRVRLGQFNPDKVDWNRQYEDPNAQYKQAADVVVQSIQAGKSVEVIDQLDALPQDELNKILAAMPPEARKKLREEYAKKDAQQANQPEDIEQIQPAQPKQGTYGWEKEKAILDQIKGGLQNATRNQVPNRY